MATNNGKAPAPIAKAGDNVSKAKQAWLTQAAALGNDYGNSFSIRADTCLALGLLWRKARESNDMADDDFKSFMTAFRPDTAENNAAGVLRSQVKSFARPEVIKALPKADTAYEPVKAYAGAVAKADRGGRDVFQCAYAVNVAITKAVTIKGADGKDVVDMKKASPKVDADFIKAATPARLTAEQRKAAAAAADTRSPAKKRADELAMARQSFAESLTMFASFVGKAKISDKAQKAFNVLVAEFAEAA